MKENVVLDCGEKERIKTEKKLDGFKIRTHSNSRELNETIDNLGLSGEAAKDYYDAHLQVDLNEEDVKEFRRLFSLL